MCAPPKLKSKPLALLALSAGILAASLSIPGLWPDPAPRRTLRQPQAGAQPDPSRASPRMQDPVAIRP